MNIKEIFEKVNLIIPDISQRRFFNFFHDTITELESTYSGYIIEKGEQYNSPKNLEANCPVRNLYSGAIVDNIVFLSTGDTSRKSEFLRKAREAYHTYWKENAKGRRLKKWSGGYV